jgi:hypothetical protein
MGRDGNHVNTAAGEPLPHLHETTYGFRSDYTVWK